MKNVIFSLLLLSMYLTANAQFSFGLKGGVNFATIGNYDNIDVPQTVVDAFMYTGDSKYRTGFHVGLLMNYMVGDGLVGFQPEILYSNQGMKNTGEIAGISGTSVTSIIKTDYINIPMMVQVNVIPRILYVEAGPQVGFLINSSAHYELSGGSLSYEDSWDIRDELNTVDFSLAFGAGFQIPKIPLGVGLRYTIGLTEVNNDSEAGNDKTVNGVLQASIFFRFGSQ